MRAKSLLVALCLPLALTSMPAIATAAATCENLRAELAGLREVIGNTAEVRRYSKTLTQQDANIRQVRSELVRYGCSSDSFTVFGGANRQACDQLKASLDDMEANRQYLVETRDNLKDTLTGGARKRRAIQAALEENGCNGTVREASLVTPAPVDEDTSDFYTRIPSPDTGALRTMCVRTCDGAFFPISADATTADFQRDAEICSQRCPGAETELYYHSLTNSESADMVSALTGRPYRALPTAFAYRNRLPGEAPICGCGVNTAATPISPIPASAEPDVSTDQRPVANLDLRPSLRPSEKGGNAVVSEAAAASVPERPYDPANNKVRVVGPQFVPAEENAQRPLLPKS